MKESGVIWRHGQDLCLSQEEPELKVNLNKRRPYRKVFYFYYLLYIWIEGTGLELSSKTGGISAEVVTEFVHGHESGYFVLFGGCFSPGNEMVGEKKPRPVQGW